MDSSSAPKIEMGSERSFGFVFAALFVIIGAWPLWAGKPLRLWAFPVAALILALGLFWPFVLRPFNRAWFNFGLALARVTTPIFLAVLYFGVVAPYGLLMRLLGVGMLCRRREPTRESYWIERTDGDPAPRSMRNQF